jgi:acetolactate synthase-1/2/3 large subunit
MSRVSSIFIRKQCPLKKEKVILKASDLFIKALEAEGVKYIFGVPGEENLDVLNSLKNSSIKLILTRHEQAAGFMASTYGRLTGKAGVCLATLGPGATNLVTAAAYAQLGGMPLVLITGQKPIKTSKQGQFQIIDVVDMMRPLTKYTQQIVSGNNIPSRVRESFRIAEEEKPGAVHLELPEDIAAEKTTTSPYNKSKVRRPIAEDKSIQCAVELIEQAKQPLLLIASGANRKLTSKMLKNFIQKTKIPFISSQMGKGVLDEDDPLFLGTAALSDFDFLHRAINKSDLIINVGHDAVEKPPFIMKPDGFKVIHINFFSAKVDPVYFPQVEVIGDIANSIWRISERLSAQNTWDLTYFKEVKKHSERYLLEEVNNQSFPIIPQKLVSDVREVMPSDGIIALDNGIYKIWFARNYKANQPNTVLLDNALAAMGAGLPSAMAAQLVYPNRRVMAICGDGGFMMNSQELETAVRLRMNFVVLVLRDDAYGMIKWKQEAMGFEAYGLDYNNPDFVKYAESYGAIGSRIESSEQLVSVLENCFSAQGVHVIDCPVDYSENNRILNYEIKEKSNLV